MQVCVIGGGVAGAMLAWRLAQQPAVELVYAPGPASPADATAVSGGSIRCFEIEANQRGLAIDSMCELVADPVLRDWAGYTSCGSVYVPADSAGLAGAVTEIEASLPGSASLLDAAELTRRGWAGLDSTVVGLYENEAGYLSPQRLRQSVLADLAGRGRVRFLTASPITELAAGQFTLAGERHSYDRVVLAAGAWTPWLLRQHGFAATGLRTKGIQYTIHQATGALPSTFVDDISDLFGKPVPGGVLLGLPTQAWDVRPNTLAPDLTLSQAAAALAVRRFPGLRLHAAAAPVTAVDCYAESGTLALRAVEGGQDRLFTFTGGTGSAAKTVLAASRRAAIQLAEDHRDRVETPSTLIGRRSSTS
ncbi:MAG: FAD-binding oxidoreductase [Actinomycetota bacterium]|nr:FAD-binding oxidoreductase [Actinomycetota bacterium]MDQ2956559.1 FAD-binding oxidoreductase [Actinomycetota bacterium]